MLPMNKNAGGAGLQRNQQVSFRCAEIAGQQVSGSSSQP
jgi:hypothetical protein